ncbi:nucleotide sugar dehydrogenase [Bosea lathyri]|uniref:UDP-glucose 6-dehydrogenase n=1 Tax=Bosea lathyri TaxID=1036778 RepID=A0A1H6BGU2_9HYPH|nr:nucleotide sugar dehydrogenase [Bosea lathyri]SEG59834.1 GDP-mannose 6-dehydrogenase [Bosea lathyri]
MKIAIYGLGYVGLTAAGCLTKEGHEVVGIDVSERKVAEAAAGISPIKEPGLEELLGEAVGKGLLTCTTSGADRIQDCDMAIVCVGTPSGSDGAHNMSFIAEVSRQIATSVDRKRTTPLTVVYRSTIRPGTIDELIRPIFKATLGGDVGVVELVYNPEFLREAVAIRDYFAPPKIVIGTHDGKSNERMEELNKNISAPVFYTGYREAEFTKFVDNTFHALKVTFANEIGRICLELGISASKVHEIFVADTKLNISPYYLRPGGAFGGSCLPKDVRALQYIAADVGVHAQLVDSLIRSNDTHKHYLFEHVTQRLAPGGSVLMLGLAFKRNSDDLRESPNVDMARKLLQAGYKLAIFDPALEPSHLVGQNLGYIFSHLPGLPDLLVSRDFILERSFDLVIDTSGAAKELPASIGPIVDINTLA